MTQMSMVCLIAAMNHAMKTKTLPLAILWLRDLLTSNLLMSLFGPKPTDKTGIGIMMKLDLPPLSTKLDAIGTD